MLLIGGMVVFVVALGAGATPAGASFCGPLNVGDTFSSQGSTLTQEQLENAQIIVETGQRLGISEHGQTIAIMTAIQEDQLRNRLGRFDPELFAAGDFDGNSVGLFQQQTQLQINGRTVDGWGTVEELSDPVTATTLFFQGKPGFPGLVSIDGWEDLDPGVAAQSVQNSDFALEYAPQFTFAQGIYQTVTGQGGASCAQSFGTVTGDQVEIQVRFDSNFNIDASIAPAVQQLINDAAADGILFGGWGHRSHQRQHELRRINGCPDGWTHTDGENPALWSGSSSCRVPTARPGSSFHESGLAIDFRCSSMVSSANPRGSVNNRGSSCYRWLETNAARYGLKNLPSEAWHWSTTGG